MFLRFPYFFLVIIGNNQTNKQLKKTYILFIISKLLYLSEIEENSRLKKTELMEIPESKLTEPSQLKDKIKFKN